MTDNEIIKALECCTKPGGCDPNCPGRKINCEIEKFALDLINRQKEEIERLHKCVKTEEEVRVIAKETIRVGVNIIRAEAIREFAERMKGEFRGLAVCGELAVCTVNSVTNKIDILAKEITQQ